MKEKLFDLSDRSENFTSVKFLKGRNNLLQDKQIVLSTVFIRSGVMLGDSRKIELVFLFFSTWVGKSKILFS